MCHVVLIVSQLPLALAQDISTNSFFFCSFFILFFILFGVFSEMRLEYVKLCRRSTSVPSFHMLHAMRMQFVYAYTDCNMRCEMHLKGLCAT